MGGDDRLTGGEAAGHPCRDDRDRCHGAASALQLRTRELVVAALATSSGFTTALFMAVGVFPAGPALAEIALGALFSVVGAVATLAMAWMLQVGRFARRRSDLARRQPIRPRHAHA